MKPSESGHCKFPEICDQSGQCENWLRNHQGCATHDPKLCGCKYLGCDMWSCGHVDGSTITASRAKSLIAKGRSQGAFLNISRELVGLRQRNRELIKVLDRLVTQAEMTEDFADYKNSTLRNACEQARKVLQG